MPPIDHLMPLDQLAISIPSSEAAVIRHFQKRIPYMLFVPEADAGTIEGARHWAALPTRSRDSGGDGGTVTIALSSSSVIAANSEGGVL
jgi:hypothetical protein